MIIKNIIVDGKELTEMATCPECGEIGELITIKKTTKQIRK